MNLALDRLLELIDDGREFPDATAKVLAEMPRVNVNALRQEYDDHFKVIDHRYD